MVTQTPLVLLVARIRKELLQMQWMEAYGNEMWTDVSVQIPMETKNLIRVKCVTSFIAAEGQPFRTKL